MQLDFKSFEYKLNDKYSDYHPFNFESNQLLLLLKSIASSHCNNPNFYFTRARDSPEIFLHTHNLPDIQNQKVVGETFSCCETCIKCSQSGVCEMYVDDFIDGNICCFESCPKTHIVFREKTKPKQLCDFEFNKPIELNYPKLQSVTFKSDEMDYRSIYRFLSTNTEAQANIEMGSKHVEVCYACESHSMMYLWNLDQSKLQAFRFDSFLISFKNNESAFKLNKPKAEILKISNLCIVDEFKIYFRTPNETKKSYKLILQDS